MEYEVLRARDARQAVRALLDDGKLLMHSSEIEELLEACDELEYHADELADEVNRLNPDSSREAAELKAEAESSRPFLAAFQQIQETAATILPLSQFDQPHHIANDVCDYLRRAA